MNYLPTTLYIAPPATNFYWGKVDDALRSAAYRCVALPSCREFFEGRWFHLTFSPCLTVLYARGVHVRLMAARWNYTDPAMYQYLASLNQLANLEVKIYQVPRRLALSLK